MTSRTFALSRQRRRRTHQRLPLVPASDALAFGQEGDTAALGDEQERRPSMQRDEAGHPVDPATHEAGVRPAAPRLPHEHDQHADAPGAPRETMVQAQRDLASGKVDTDLRGKAAEVFDRAPRRRRHP